MKKLNQLHVYYTEANKPKAKKPLEPTYSNSQKMPKFPKKGTIFNIYMYLRCTYIRMRFIFNSNTCPLNS